ncbi:hypothetical protein ACLOJK_013212 [Asimina triloba]
MEDFKRRVEEACFLYERANSGRLGLAVGTGQRSSIVLLWSANRRKAKGAGRQRAEVATNLLIIWLFNSGFRQNPQQIERTPGDGLGLLLTLHAYPASESAIPIFGFCSSAEPVENPITLEEQKSSRFILVLPVRRSRHRGISPFHDPSTAGMRLALIMNARTEGIGH